MRILNIVIGHYPDLFYRTGGLQIQIVNTYQELKNLGHNVAYYHEWLQSPFEIDIYHQFNINISTNRLLIENRKLAKKVVVSPIFFTTSPVYKRVMKAINYIPKLNYQNYNQLKQSLSAIDGFVFLGNNERLEFEKFYNFKATNYCNIPNGIRLNTDILCNDKSVGEKNKKYIVNVGTICKNKNQKKLIQVCIELGIPLKIIGPFGESDYYEECKKVAQGYDVEFLGELDNRSGFFLDLVKEAKVFCLVSFSEVLPISVFEALGLGTKVVCTKNCSVPDYVYDERIVYCEPTDLKSIKNAISVQFNSDYHFDGNDIIEKYSWTNVAAELLAFYEKTLRK